jgi:hypothetical protein
MARWSQDLEYQNQRFENGAREMLSGKELSEEGRDKNKGAECEVDLETLAPGAMGRTGIRDEIDSCIV